MSPEQARSEALDCRSDLWSASAVLYECLTGTPPFDRPTAAEVVAGLLRDPIAPIRALRPDCPEALERIVLGGLTRERGERHRGPRAMARELGRFQREAGLPRGRAAFRVVSPPVWRLLTGGGRGDAKEGRPASVTVLPTSHPPNGLRVVSTLLLSLMIAAVWLTVALWLGERSLRAARTGHPAADSAAGCGRAHGGVLNESATRRVPTVSDYGARVMEAGGTPLQAGDWVGPNLVVRNVLGFGGSGVVYEAEHVRLGSRVAVKVLSVDDRYDAETREALLTRFSREARVCGVLRSVHVPQVHDVGWLPDGSPYLVMELLRGETLEQRLDRGRIALPVAIEIARQVLAALAAAHRFGALHRDVKPGNIVIHRDDDDQPIVKLVDFGICKTVGNSGRHVTLEGLVVGTPHYMAPEQVRAEPLDARADLYAAGVLLYEMVTDRPPFDGSTVAEVTAAVLRDAVVPPSVLRGECPRELEALVVRTMSRDRRQRFASAGQMEMALGALVRRLGWPSGRDVWALEREAPGRSLLEQVSGVMRPMGADHDSPDPRYMASGSARDPRANGASMRDWVDGPPAPLVLDAAWARRPTHILGAPPPAYGPTRRSRRSHLWSMAVLLAALFVLLTVTAVGVLAWQGLAFAG